MSGKKRASPGTDTEKNPLEGVELGDEDAQKLQDVQKQIERTELLLGTLHFRIQLFRSYMIHIHLRTSRLPSASASLRKATCDC
jgi:hypothetical protein